MKTVLIARGLLVSQHSKLGKKKKKELKALTLDDLEQVFLALPFLSLALTQTTSHRHQRG